MSFDNYVKTNFKNLKRSTKVFMEEAYEAWQASASREGYKLVPLEPSEEMIEAGCRAYMDCGVTQVYKAMVGVFHED